MPLLRRLAETWSWRRCGHQLGSTAVTPQPWRGSRLGCRSRWLAPAVAAAAVGVSVHAASSPTTASLSATEDDQGGALSRWLQQRGATLGEIYFAPAGATGDGAYVAADVAAGTALLNLPADAVLTSACACSATDVGKELTELRERLQPSAGANVATLDALLLSVMLVELRCRSQTRSKQPSSASSWEEWVSTLPSPEAVDIPLCWNDAQLECLRGTPVHGVASARRAWLDSLSQSLPPLLSEVGLSAAGLALSESAHWLRWADALVWSRAVCLPGHVQGEQDEELAMLPGVDMCNHTVDPAKVSARWVCTMRYDGVSLVAAAGGRGERGGEDLKAGDELLLSYGPRLAEELLHVYGFLPESIADSDSASNTSRHGSGPPRTETPSVTEKASASAWDAAVLLVPCDTSPDGEEEIELSSRTSLGSDPRLPSEHGWELIKVVLALCSPPPGTGVTTTVPKRRTDAGWDVIFLRQKVGVSVSEAQLSAALRRFVGILDMELSAIQQPTAVDVLTGSGDSCTEARRATLANRYLTWRHQRLVDVRGWCESLRCGLDAEGPTWWADCT